MEESFYYKFDDLFNPTLTALHDLGGSASVEELEEAVSKILQLSDEQVNDIHRGSTTKLKYRLAWARNYLKRYGLLENSERGVWALTKEGNKVTSVDQNRVKKKVVVLDRKKRSVRIQSNTPKSIEDLHGDEMEQLTWQQEVIDLLQTLPPSSFERLCQRLLRELGINNVQVTGKSNDGGIDGKGILQFAGVLSFPIIFQAKRYKGNVSSSIVRDFRGAMIGRADKGLIITTGVFTREAKKEAQRDGAPIIDLIDGNQLAEKLKDLRLGVDVDVELVENVNIKKDWFKSL